MSDADHLRLNILVEGEDPRDETFPVTISRGATFDDLEEAIREAYKRKTFKPVGRLRLFRANATEQEIGRLTLSDEMILGKRWRVASVWPAQSTVDDQLIHIVVRFKDQPHDLPDQPHNLPDQPHNLPDQPHDLPDNQPPVVTPAPTTAEETTNDPLACDICQRGGPSVQCSRCKYRFCTVRCMSIAPDETAQDPEAFWCPDCLGDLDVQSKNATRKFSSPMTAILTISLPGLGHAAGHLAEMVYGRLLVEGLPVQRWDLELPDMIDSKSIIQWFKALPRTACLLVFVVTETTITNGWMNFDPDSGHPVPQGEAEFLDRLFVNDAEVSAQISRFRQSFLFMVSCGGNYKYLSDKPAFKSWIPNRKVFKFEHLIGFLNPHLVVSELHGFLSQFAQLVCSHGHPAGYAVVDAYMRDERMRVHTDLIWFTQVEGRIIVIRHAPPKSRPWGIDLPTVESVCCCDSEGVKRWVVGREYKREPPLVVLPYHTSCCRIYLRVVLPKGGAVPQRHVDASFIRDLWPAQPEHYFEVSTTPHRAE